MLLISPAGCCPGSSGENTILGRGSSLVRIGFGYDVKHPAFHGILVGSIVGALIINLQLVDLRLLITLPARRNHLGQIDVKNPACRHVIENIFSAEPRHLFSAIHKPAADRIALPMTVDGG